MITGGRTHVDHCLNCGAATPGEFCSKCGQEALDARVRFRNQLAHFFEEVFNFESRLPQTMKLLMARPGALTRAYNGGQRARYVTPLKLYLFASLGFFLVLSLSASHEHKSGSHRDIAIISFQSDAPEMHPPQDRDAGVDDIEVKSPEQFDEWLKNPDNAAEMPAFLRPHIRSLLQSPQGFMGALVDMLSKASMALVPIHALLLNLFYWRPRRFYGEHIVFSLHLHSFAYVAYGFATLLGLVASGTLASLSNVAVFAGTGAYTIAAAHTAYGEGVLRSALKMAAVGFAYALALVGVLLFAATIAFFMN